jgi:hypothetical protein
MPTIVCFFGISGHFADVPLHLLMAKTDLTRFFK